MKKIKTALYLLILLTIYSCGENAKKPVDLKKEAENQPVSADLDIDLIKKHIELQKNIASDENNPDNPYDPTQQDLDLATQIITLGLTNDGFKPVSKEVFDTKIKTFFNITRQQQCLLLDFDTDYITFYTEKLDGTKKTLQASKYYSPNLFFSEKQHIMLTNVTLNTLIEIQPNNSYDIKIPQFLLARNKYLFNDSEKDKLWLMENDSYFMEKLVKEFGYTNDKDLLLWEVKRTKFNESDPEDFGKLFWTSYCDGTIKVQSNIYKVLQKLYTPQNMEDRFLLDNIQKYITYLLKPENKEDGLSDTNRLKIVANMVYFAEQYKYNPKFASNNRMMGRLRYLLSDDRSLLEKNNFFNLPQFKAWWDKAEFDMAYVTECEYEGTCGPGNPGPDPKDYPN